MLREQKGFTLIELMIVCIIIGILAAIAIPCYVTMLNRSNETSTKANMHTLQLAAEDYAAQNKGVYATTMDGTHITPSLPGGGATGANFVNPFSGGTGSGNAWENRTNTGANAAPVPGISSYADSASANTYNIKGYGKSAAIGLTLTSGR
jgi:prepilin-type N-terminal cleavage/methylation domain-containing protein